MAEQDADQKLTRAERRHSTSSAERDVAPAESERPEFAMVESGDSLNTFAERYGVDAAELVRLNERELQNQAQARGHSHTFRSYTRDETGREDAYTGYHVFPGEQLRLRAAEE